MNYVINFSIQNNDEKIIKKNIKTKYKNNELSFKYDNESIKITIKKDNIIMYKENNESILTFNFIKNKETESKYFIKSLNFYIDTKIKTNKLEIKKDRLYIEYELYLQDEYSGKFIYEIQIKEMK